jgi:hypothetical protein
MKQIRSIRPFIAMLAAGICWLSASTARADDTTDVDRAQDGSYAYSFRDDPLSAAGNFASSARIRVRPQGVRRTLLRPRLSFVPEMLKSVENI